MTRADRLCIKVALWPVLTFVIGLLSLMMLRVVSGADPLPNGSAQYVVSGSLLVTFGALTAANLLRVRLAR
jgi:hypothetical protein